MENDGFRPPEQDILEESDSASGLTREVPSQSRILTAGDFHIAGSARVHVGDNYVSTAAIQMPGKADKLMAGLASRKCINASTMLWRRTRAHIDGFCSRQRRTQGCMTASLLGSVILNIKMEYTESMVNPVLAKVLS